MSRQLFVISNYKRWFEVENKFAFHLPSIVLKPLHLTKFEKVSEMRWPFNSKNAPRREISISIQSCVALHDSLDNSLRDFSKNLQYLMQSTTSAGRKNMERDLIIDPQLFACFADSCTCIISLRMKFDAAIKKRSRCTNRKKHALADCAWSCGEQCMPAAGAGVAATFTQIIEISQ